MTKRRIQVRADGLAHLHPEVAPWIDLSPGERRRRLVAARANWFVTYPQAEKALAYIADIMQAPPSPRPLNLLIHGEPSIGKSQIIRRALQIYPPQDQGGSWPILFVEAPPSLTENSLYNALCEALNLPFRATETSETKRCKLIAALQTNQVRIIIIDEFHNLLSRPGRPQRELLASLRHFGNKLGISFIAAGTSEALSAIETDPHVAGRFRCLNMPRWRRDRTFQNMVASLEPLLPLMFPSNLTERPLVGTLWDMCEGLLGELALLLVDATLAAISSEREVIDLELLETLGWVPPSRRMRQARHELRQERAEFAGLDGTAVT